MLLQILAVAVSWFALGLAAWALVVAHRHPFRKWTRGVGEEIEAQNLRIERLREDWQRERERIVKTYRANARAVTRLEDLAREGDEGAEESEDRDVSDEHGNASPRGGLRPVSPDMVLSGIWGGGRTG